MTTEHLIIRKWDETQFDRYYFLSQESASGAFFDAWTTEEKDAKGFFSWQLSKYEKMDPIEDVIGLAIEERETGQIIGHGGIGKHDGLDETAIFYGIVRASRRQG